jgi:hypothetical protein
MDQERDQIREIEDARTRVSEDVRAVAENANVVQRAKETVGGRMREARGKLEDARDAARDAALSLDPRENPLGMMLAGLAAGLLIGMLIPVSPFETRRIRPIARDVKERAKSAGNEAVRRGSEVIKETLDAGSQAARSSLREQMRDFGSEE